MEKSGPELIQRHCPTCRTPSRAMKGARPSLDRYAFPLNFIGRDRPQSSTTNWEHCSNCHLEFASRSPSQDWFSHHYQVAGETDLVLDQYAARTAARLWLKWMPSSVGSVLDIGCGRGLFLHNLKGHGIQVCGSEPNEKLRQVSPLSPDEILSPKQLSTSSRRFSALSFQLSLEHLFLPRETLRDLASHLQPEAFLFILYHSTESWPHRLLGRKSPLYDIQHLQIFNSESLRRLVESEGFKVVRDRAYWNTYPLWYWGRLLGWDLPVSSVTNLSLPLSAGNHVFIAHR